MATIVHFNITATDPDRAKKFYQNLFGWKIEPLPGPMNYALIETLDLNGNKSLGGGMAKREPGDAPGTVNYVGVKSIDESLAAIVKLGGKIIQPKQAVPGFGFLAGCLDTEDNPFGVFQEL